MTAAPAVCPRRRRPHRGRRHPALAGANDIAIGNVTVAVVIRFVKDADNCTILARRTTTMTNSVSGFRREATWGGAAGNGLVFWRMEGNVWTRTGFITMLSGIDNTVVIVYHYELVNGTVYVRAKAINNSPPDLYQLNNSSLLTTINPDGATGVPLSIGGWLNGSSVVEAYQDGVLVHEVRVFNRRLNTWEMGAVWRDLAKKWIV